MVCYNTEDESLDRNLGTTNDTDEYAFHDSDRLEKCGQHDIGCDMGITAKYNMMIITTSSSWET